MEAMPIAMWVVVMLVVLALAFDFMNGFHDAANSIATVVSTGVLKPHHAVAFAAFFNVVAIFAFELKVAATVGKGIVEPGVVDQHVIFGALVGGIAGATLAKAGMAPLIWPGILKTVAFILVSPAMGFVLGAALMIGVAWLLRRTSPLRVDNWFRRLQLASAGAYSLGHGGNDAQKTIGIVWLLLIAAGLTDTGAARPPGWVVWSCYIAIGLGT